MLTSKQKELLMFIHERLKESGVPPSFDEMKEALGPQVQVGHPPPDHRPRRAGLRPQAAAPGARHGDREAAEFHAARGRVALPRLLARA